MEMNNHYVGLPRLFSRFTEIRYINGWIIFSVDLVISLCVSLIGVLGIFSFLGVSYAQEDVVKVGFASFVGRFIVVLFVIPLCVAYGEFGEWLY